jgi:hypothetical protein
MTWTLHRWVWKLEAPLFVGMPPAGALNRCRLYVPARTVWGAVTAELARENANGGEPDYRATGDALLQHARFTYLFPAEWSRGSWRAWLPRFEDDRGLVWVREDLASEQEQRVSDRNFRRRLIGGRPGTAIDPDTDSAADGSLRETECVAAHWRCSIPGEPVGSMALAGYVFLRAGDHRPSIDSVNTLFLGGDTRYGMGRVRREVWEETDRVFGAKVATANDGVSVERRVALAHASAAGAMRGQIERLVGWDRRSANLTVQHDRPLWVPGSGTDHVRRWIIEPDGCWSCANDPMAASADAEPRSEE